MKILVDADSCPKPVREFLLRICEKKAIKAVFAANRIIPGITGKFSSMELCGKEEGSADRKIRELAEAGDLAVTRDLPLAELLVEKNVTVLDDRGRIFTSENIHELRSMRDFMVQLAENNMGIERKPSYGKKDLKKFADSLTQFI